MSLLTLHLVVLCATALFIVYADHEAFAYIRGKKKTLHQSTTRWLHRFVWLGLALMVGSGLLLMLPAAKFYLTEPTFLLKMFFVAVLIGNGVVIGKLSKVAAEIPFASLPARKKQALFVSGAASTLGWAGAAVLGFFFI